jgi:hypothetical protein
MVPPVSAANTICGLTLLEKEINIKIRRPKQVINRIFRKVKKYAG